MQYKLKTMGLLESKFANKGALSPAGPIFIACNQQKKSVVDLLDKELPGMQQDGSLEKILAKYGLHKWW